MNSTLKILVPIVLLLGGVFALTYFAQYTPHEDESKGPEIVTTRKPLQFFTSRRTWLPRQVYDRYGGSLQDVEFTGYYEPGETQNGASFWFANTSSSPVRIGLKSVSCNTCSGGKMAPIPTEVTKQIFQMSAISALPQGFVSGMPLLMAVPGAQLDAKRDTLKWTYHAFLKPDEVNYEVPAAPPGDPWAQQWAIMELLFKAKPGNVANTLSAQFVTSVAGEEGVYDEKLEILYMSAPPFELDKASISVGELTESSAVQNHEILIYSSTRKPSQLPKFDIVVTMPGGVSGEPGPFVSAGTPIPVPEADHFELMEMLSGMKKRPVRVQAAYRLPVTVSPKIGAAKLDIGRVERNVNVSFGSESIPVRVSGTMLGPIQLAGVKELAFGNFAYTDVQTVSAKVETDKTGVELRIVPELTQPKSLKVELEKQPDIGERGVYRLKATMPAKEQLGEILDGVVVLEAKGPNPLRLRVPVTGRGR